MRLCTYDLPHLYIFSSLKFSQLRSSFKKNPVVNHAHGSLDLARRAVAGGDAGVPAETRPPPSLRGKNSAVDVESWVEEKGLSSQGWGFKLGLGSCPGGFCLPSWYQRHLT